ncbi:MAG: XrtA/PEP-CTERM system exopolysaccharide export protein [Pseudomonadota bacterium]
MVLEKVIKRLSLAKLLKSLFFTLVCCVGISVTSLSLAAQPPSPDKKPTRLFDSSQYYDGDYIIGVGDEVMINVWRNPELSLTVPVRPDGSISAPLVGDIKAAGKTPSELSKMLKDRLQQYVRDPEVSVILTGLNSHEYVSRVRVTGAVRNPVSVPHRMGMTALDLLLDAGGLNEFASGNKTVLYRKLPDGTVKSLRIKVEDILKKGRLETNVLLRPGDVLTVPESLF